VRQADQSQPSVLDQQKKFHPVLNPVIMEVQKFFPTESIKFMGYVKKLEEARLCCSC
jgi:hypothetical protein